MFTAAGKSAAVSAANYIEDVFSTYLYTATGPSSGQTITNNIDLSGKGGMLWIKDRTDAGTYPVIVDTARGANKWIYTSSTAAAATSTSSVTAFNSNGFTLGTDSGSGDSNSVNYAYSSPTNMVSWTFRKQAKFFDVVTYTGNGVAGRTVSHNLGSTPGCIIVKRTNDAKEWNVYHRSMTANGHLELDSTAAKITSAQAWNNTEPTSTVFTVGNDLAVNGNGSTYVAYLFAHNAGGFGATGSDNVISCGSYTGNGSTAGPIVTLGYEPQWLLIKRASGGTGNWILIDSMRGFVNSTSATPSDAYLVANTTAAESTWGAFTGTDNAAIPLATGFQIVTSTATLNNNGDTYIYIAIRRGPMKTPTSGTSVFMPIARTGTGSATTVTGFNSPLDTVMVGNRPTSTDKFFVPSRLMGTFYVRTNLANVESSNIAAFPTDNIFDVQNGFKLPTTTSNVTNGSGLGYINYGFSRAPGFFDVVCYTGTGSNDNKNHNLTVVPELIILKARSSAIAWYVMGDAVLGGAGRYLSLNTTAAYGTGATHLDWTSTTFSVGSLSDFNGSGTTYVSYLFASLAGVSKVGSYTGTGALQTINCGFAAGARFVLIKRTDSTGDWWVYDSARGITSGNDPYLLLNSTAAEVTGTNYVDTASTGFQVTAAAPAGLNANGGTYIFLAIA